MWMLEQSPEHERVSHCMRLYTAIFMACERVSHCMHRYIATFVTCVIIFQQLHAEAGVAKCSSSYHCISWSQTAMYRFSDYKISMPNGFGFAFRKFASFCHFRPLNSQHSPDLRWRSTAKMCISYTPILSHLSDTCSLHTQSCPIGVNTCNVHAPSCLTCPIRVAYTPNLVSSVLIHVTCMPHRVSPV